MGNNQQKDKPLTVAQGLMLMAIGGLIALVAFAASLLMVR